MPRSFSRATGPRAFRNVDVIHSGPAEPFRSILLMAYSSAERVNPFFELSNNIGIFDGHGRVVYFAVVINEDIGHCFSNGQLCIDHYASLLDWEFVSGVLPFACLVHCYFLWCLQVLPSSCWSWHHWLPYWVLCKLQSIFDGWHELYDGVS